MIIEFKTKRLLKIGFKSLWRHKLRSALTVLGITFGVCSVIAMLAIGQGAGYEAQRQIAALGSHNIILQSVPPPRDTDSDDNAFVLEYGLRYLDAERIKNTVPNVSVLTQARKIRQTAKRGVWSLETNLVGTSPWYPEAGNLRVREGRFFEERDMHQRANVCVAGRKAAETLFPFGGAVGNIINIDDQRFRVIGVLGGAGRGEADELEARGDPDTDIYIPMTTMQNRFGEISQTGSGMSGERVELHEIIVQVDQIEAIPHVERMIEQILARGRTRRDYTVIVPYQLLEQARQTTRIFSIVLGSIAAISLVVGGIGIMNITLATVMERTREIGIRRAVGAKKKHIVEQFLTETVLLSLCGGALGIILGLSAPYFVTRFAGMETIVTVWSLLLAFGISALVGLLSGIYPAYRAANMDPIEALRHE